MSGSFVGGRWDRAWAGVWITVIVRPLVGVTVESVNRRHAGLLARLPADNWLASVPGPVATEYVGDLEAAAVAATAQPCEGAPIRVLVQGDAVAIMFSHGVGDGQIMIGLTRDLLAPEDADYVLPTWRRPSQATIALAGLRHWWTHRRGVPAMLRALRAPGSPATGPAPGDDAVLISRAIDADGLSALRAYRDAGHPSVSLSMTLLALVLDEMAARDVHMDDALVSVSLRRYLARPERTAGNLVGILRLRARGRTAEDLAEELRRDLDSGLPLAQFLLGSARHLLRRHRPVTVPRVTPAMLGWSDLGPALGWDVVPWAPGPRQVVPGMVPSWGRRIGINLLRVDGSLHLSCLVNADAFDPTAVADALDAVISRLRPTAAATGGVAS